VVTVLVASLALFVAISVVPGDPIAALLGGRGTPEEYAALRERFGLDDPLWLRYVHWLTNAIHGDFGYSITYKTPVSDLLAPRIPITFELVLYAGILIVVAGVGLGILGGYFRRAGAGVAAVSGLGVAIPTFVAAQFLIAVFAVRLGWFPVLGAGDSMVDRVQHLTLPAVALMISWSAYVAQVTRASVGEAKLGTHVETAIGRGGASGMVFRRHVLRNAAIPIMTVSALAVAGLVAGAMVVEIAFGLGGIGALLVQSIATRDFNVVLAISLIMLVVFVLATTLIDIVHVLLDPRARERQG
jgi:peptide/nickel transport system permease protein